MLTNINSVHRKSLHLAHSIHYFFWISPCFLKQKTENPREIIRLIVDGSVWQMITCLIHSYYNTCWNPFVVRNNFIQCFVHLTTKGKQHSILRDPLKRCLLSPLRESVPLWQFFKGPLYSNVLLFFKGFPVPRNFLSGNFFVWIPSCFKNLNFNSNWSPLASWITFVRVGNCH